MSDNKPSINISGSGRVSGGAYESISISGSGHVKGDAEAGKVRISGSAHFDGALNVHGNLHCSGSCRVDGTLRAVELLSSGSLHLEAPSSCSKLHSSGSVHAQSINVHDFETSGSADVDGALSAKRLKCSGTLRVSEGIECEEAFLSGKADVHGLFNAHKLEIEIHGRTPGFIEEIGCDTLTIRPNRDVFHTLFGGPGKVRAITIEGNDIDIEYTEADVVRGARVVIGPGCDIKRVEYTVSLTVSPEARVGEQVKA